MTLAELDGERRSFGIWTNLYTIRSEKNFGVGDLTDLQQLAAWAARHGAEFVGINPLHSLRHRDADISPYRPNSRLFNNEIYLDVTVVPELADSPAARELLKSADFLSELDRMRSGDRIRYQPVASLKRRVLELLFETLLGRNGNGTGRRYEQFLAFKRSAGPELTAFATHRALEDHFVSQGIAADWHVWPEPFRQQDSTAVREFCSEHAGEIDFYCYQQFELDRQLAEAATQAQSSMSIGLYGDLALGSDPKGAETWTNQGLFVDGAHIGAPPDEFAVDGQNWGLPPIAPHALRAACYRHWIRLLRASMRHVGALRIDHVMGLFRQFWIPHGLSGSKGAYIKYPAEHLLGILALESHRNRTIVVGEDLGTVPRGFQARLARWGILSSRVLYFEQDQQGAFRPAARYSSRAIATANTHDQVPLAGYWTGGDLDLRQRACTYSSREAYELDKAKRARAVSLLHRRLRSEDCLPTNGHADSVQLSRGVYTFLAKTPAPLIGVSLDDLACEVDPVNLPGVGADRFPSWTRRMHVTLENLMQDAAVAETLHEVRKVRSSPEVVD
jgi:4-alpha-glucanotransferase